MPDATIGHVCKGVNGPLMLALAKSCGFKDLDVVNLFRDGAPLLGRLDRCVADCLRARTDCCRSVPHRAGLGKEIPYEAEEMKELHRLREGRNVELLRSLKDSELSESLMDSCRKDQNEGRMDVMRSHSEPSSSRTWNMPCQLACRNEGQVDLAGITISPRFGVEQGV